MVNIIKAEHQKAKRTMRKKFIWGFPLLTFVMAFIFTLGMTNAYAESVWNWWYTLLLPGMIALFCYLSVAQEKKIKYYHLMTIPTDRRKLLLGKIIYIGYMILFSNVIVFAGATLGGEAACRPGRRSRVLRIVPQTACRRPVARPSPPFSPLR